MLDFCQDMYDNKLAVKAAAKKKPPAKTTPKKKAKCSTKKKIFINDKETMKETTTDHRTLKAMYHDQERWRKNGWTPADWIVGTCVVPPYNTSKDYFTISALDGHLRLIIIILIGKSVGAALSRSRLEEVVA